MTGRSASQLGEGTISKGTWDGSKLVFAIESQGGTINMTAMLKDGKLVGDFDYARQLSGKWEASKK